MIILTGFQPFLLDNINSSWEVVKSLPEGDDSFLCCELPVEYEVCFQKLKYFVESQTDKVDYIFLFGQATERTAISIERVALNWNESRHSDESGVLKVGEFIIPGAPNCYLQNWNFLNTELENIKELQISYSAGAYVCNDLYYRALHHWPQLRNRDRKSVV